MINTAFGACGTSLYILSAVPAVLTAALPVTSKSIEQELSVSKTRSWKYTAVLEKLTDPDSQPRECDASTVLLKQALYNVRQHEVFLKMLLVRRHKVMVCVNVAYIYHNYNVNLVNNHFCSLLRKRRQVNSCFMSWCEIYVKNVPITTRLIHVYVPSMLTSSRLSCHHS